MKDAHEKNYYFQGHENPPPNTLHKSLTRPMTPAKVSLSFWMWFLVLSSVFVRCMSEFAVWSSDWNWLS